MGQTQLLRQLCVLTVLLISVPAEVFVQNGTTGWVKEVEKMLLTRWMS